MNHEDLEGEFLQYASIVKLTEGQEMTPADLNAAITAIRAGVDIFKASSNLKDAESMRIVTSVERELSKLDIELSNLETALASKNRELLAKDNEIDQLKEQIKKLTENPQKLTLKGKFYYKQDDERPFCPACYDSTQKTSSLTEVPLREQSIFGYRYRCTACKATHTA